MSHYRTRFRQYEKWLLWALVVLALGLRLWRLDSVPPGWRDDELINSLVISQKVLDGDLALYYADASGHEALYHALNAIFLGLFGPGVAGIRWLSVLLGTVTVLLTYLLGKRLFGSLTGATAALGMAFSFWSLMYSRIGLRHVLMPVLVLAAFYFFWRGMETGDRRLEIGSVSTITNLRSPISNYLLSALFMGLGFYTYFAGRGVPLILVAFCGYVWSVKRPLFRREWQHWLLTFAVTALLAVPLAVTLARQPEVEGRVAELAVPIVEAQAGNWAPLLDYTVTTLSMFHTTGDSEWLYNIPNRPVFGLVGALFFWSGVAIALYYALRFTFYRAKHRNEKESRFALACALLLLWWLAGIAPAFVSVPPASLGHTIVAQPAVFLLAALPVWRLETGNWRLETGNWRLETGNWRLAIGDRRSRTRTQSLISNLQSLVPATLALVLVAAIAARDLPDYFREWPRRGMVRFLYRADIGEVADYAAQRPTLTDFGVSSLLAGPWDKIAFAIEAGEAADELQPRWYNPERAVLLQPALSFGGYPQVEQTYSDWHKPLESVGGYQLSRIERTLPVNNVVCFSNGLCLLTAVYDPTTHYLELGWRVARELDLSPEQIISNPPPPGVYAGPRLWVFAQLQDTAGDFLAGNDGLWVDPYSLRPGDIFLQRHRLPVPEGATAETAVFGLYDPKTGERVLTKDGRDHLRLEIRG